MSLIHSNKYPKVVFFVFCNYYYMKNVRMSQIAEFSELK